MYWWDLNNREAVFSKFKSLFLTVCFLLDINGLQAQQPIDNVKDSLSFYADLFEKYINEENSDKAIYYGKKWKETWDKEDLEKDTIYCNLAAALYLQYFFHSDYKTSSSIIENILPTVKKLFGEYSLKYALSLADLGVCYYNLGFFSDAISLETEILKIFKKVVGTSHPNYTDSLHRLALYYNRAGKYIEALRYEKEVMEIYKDIYGTEHEFYATALNNLSSLYSDIGNYQEAIRFSTEALELDKKILGTDNPSYAITIGNLAKYNYFIGNYPEAVRWGTEAMLILKRNMKQNHKEYVTSVSNLANFYHAIGNDSEAIRLGKEALELSRDTDSANQISISVIINSLSLFYLSLGNYNEAIRLGTEALNLRKELLGQEHPYYAMSLNNLAGCYSECGNYIEAIRLETEALKIYERVFGSDHLNYALFLDNLAKYNFALGNYMEANRLKSDASLIIKRELGPDHPGYAESLFYESTNYLQFGKYSEAYNLLKHYTSVIRNIIFNSFSELSIGLQESLWGRDYSYDFNSLYPSVIYRINSKESVGELYDKTALFAKGILLNSSVGMRKLILESGDSILLSKYDALSANKSIYNNNLDKPIKERFLDVDSLYTVIQTQEMELARESKAYGDFARNLRITWRDVQQNLDDDDIAVEFLDFPVFNTDSTMYVALTLKKGYDSPRLIPLFEKKQLEGVSESSYYTSKDLYELIWNPLGDELKGVRDVYFSPSGELHRIGIEYLPVTNEENICDRFSLHRLSSTRQLALIQDEVRGENSVLYGGLRYDAVLDNTSREISDDVLAIPAYMNRANVDSLSLRDTYVYLPGTKGETDEIVSYLSDHSIPYTYYSGNDGTEESFKQLDGSKPRMLHIATHGFYLTRDDAKESDLVGRMLLNNRNSYHEDKPMTRSGLLLSGCGPALKHEYIPDGVEDGILTAQEISKLDLRGLDLVVLSACQTGLGDITSGEGVFGLQRGFKNAGARTIIMSLWKVDDIATQQLMSSFYSHYLNGMEKEEAFRLAQDELRKEDSSEQKKPNWAAFVIMDGIEYE